MKTGRFPAFCARTYVRNVPRARDGAKYFGALAALTRSSRDLSDRARDLEKNTAQRLDLSPHFSFLKTLEQLQSIRGELA